MPKQDMAKNTNVNIRCTVYSSLKGYSDNG